MSLAGADATESSSSDPAESFRNFLLREPAKPLNTESGSDFICRVQSTDLATSNRLGLSPLLLLPVPEKKGITPDYEVLFYASLFHYHFREQVLKKVKMHIFAV